MKDSYPVGQAPWEAGQNSQSSFPVGKAPWEAGTSQSTPSYLQQGASAVGNAVKGVATNLARGPLTMAARPGQALGVGIAGLASKITGNPDYYNRAMNTVDSPSQGFGGIIKPISQETPETIAGEGASTAALGIGNPWLGGAVAGAGNAMQDKQGLLGVGLQAGVGSLTAGIASKVASPLLNKLIGQRAEPIESTLTNSLSTTPEDAGMMASTLKDSGITDIATPTSLARAQNLAETTVENIQQALAKAPDSPELLSNLEHWQTISNALTRTARVPIAPTPAPSPGFLSQLYNKTKYPVGIGLGTLGAYEGTNPKSVVNQTLQAGGL